MTNGRFWAALALLSTVSVTLACGRSPVSSTSPTSSAKPPSDAPANADGTTLKVTAPSPASPVNDALLEELTPTLTVNPATAKYTTGTLSYEFEVFDPTNTKVQGSSQPSSPTSATATNRGRRRSLLQVREGGANGPVVKSVGASYKAPYAPNPHLIRLGSVQGRAGSETLPGAVIRNVWVSANPRPAFPGDN